MWKALIEFNSHVGRQTYGVAAFEHITSTRYDLCHTSSFITLKLASSLGAGDPMLLIPSHCTYLHLLGTILRSLGYIFKAPHRRGLWVIRLSHSLAGYSKCSGSGRAYPSRGQYLGRNKGRFRAPSSMLESV